MRETVPGSLIETEIGRQLLGAGGVGADPEFGLALVRSPARSDVEAAVGRQTVEIDAIETDGREGRDAGREGPHLGEGGAGRALRAVVVEHGEREGEGSGVVALGETDADAFESGGRAGVETHRVLHGAGEGVRGSEGVLLPSKAPPCVPT